MDEDLYSDSDGGDTAMMDKPKEKSKGDYSQTFLVPKAVFGGQSIKPGSVWDFEVVTEHDDEVELKYYMPPKKEKKTEMPEKPTAKESGMSDMDSMYE